MKAVGWAFPLAHRLPRGPLAPVKAVCGGGGQRGDKVCL